MLSASFPQPSRVDALSWTSYRTTVPHSCALASVAHEPPVRKTTLKTTPCAQVAHPTLTRKHIGLLSAHLTLKNAKQFGPTLANREASAKKLAAILENKDSSHLVDEFVLTLHKKRQLFQRAQWCPLLAKLVDSDLCYTTTLWDRLLIWSTQMEKRGE